MIDDLLFAPLQSNLGKYLSIPQVRDIFTSLKCLCDDDIDEKELEQQVALTCAEAIRYAYKLSREVGIDKETFLVGFKEIVRVEDEDYRGRYYN